MAELIKVNSRDHIKSVEKECPHLEGAKVEFYLDITPDDLDTITKTDDNLVGGYLIAEKVIKSWNFGNDEGELIEINREGMQTLSQKTQSWIMKTSMECLGMREKEKKESPES